MLFYGQNIRRQMWQSFPTAVQYVLTPWGKYKQVEGHEC